MGSWKQAGAVRRGVRNLWWASQPNGPASLPSSQSKPDNVHKLLHRCLITAEQQICACGRIIKTKSKNTVMAWGPEHGPQHMCTPQNSATDEQSWLDLGRTVTKLIRATELCGSAVALWSFSQTGFNQKRPSTLSRRGKHPWPKTQQEGEKRFTEMQKMENKNQVVTVAYMKKSRLYVIYQQND